MSDRRLLGAGLIALAGAGVGAIANLALALVLGHGLGPVGTGTFFAVLAAFTIAANVLELGADTGAVRFMARQRAAHQVGDLSRTIRVALVPVVLVGAGVALLVWWGADVAAGFLGAAEDRAARAEAYRLLAPFVLAGSVLAVLLGAVRGLGRVTPVILIQNIGVPLARLAVVTALLGAGFGVLTLLRWWAIGLPVAVGIAAVVLWRVLRRAEREDPRAAAGVAAPGDPGLRRSFWGFAAPRAVAAAVEIVLEWLDVLVVAVLTSPAQAGVYAVVTRVVRVGLLLDQATRVALGPRISALAGTGRTEELGEVYRGATRAVAALAVPAYVSLFAFAPVVLGWFGAGFQDGATALRVSCLGMLVVLCAGPLQSVILMAGRSSWQLSNKLLALTVFAVLLVVLVPPLGIVGASVAWVLALATDTGRALRQAVRLGIRLTSAPTVLLALVAVLVFGAVATLTQMTMGGGAALAVHVPVSLSLYAAILWWCGDRLGVPRLSALRTAVAAG